MPLLLNLVAIKKVIERLEVCFLLRYLQLDRLSFFLSFEGVLHVADVVREFTFTPLFDSEAKLGGRSVSLQSCEVKFGKVKSQPGFRLVQREL